MLDWTFRKYYHNSTLLNFIKYNSQCILVFSRHDKIKWFWIKYFLFVLPRLQYLNILAARKWCCVKFSIFQDFCVSTLKKSLLNYLFTEFPFKSVCRSLAKPFSKQNITDFYIYMYFLFHIITITFIVFSPDIHI